MNKFVFIVFNLFILTVYSIPQFNITLAEINKTTLVQAGQSLTTVVFYTYPEAIYNYHAFRLFVKTKLNPLQSLLIIIKDDRSVVSSFEIFHEYNQSEMSAARTICPFLSDSSIGIIRNRTLSIEFSSQSSSIIDVNVTVKNFNFLLSTNELRNLSISKNTPYYFLFKFQQSIERVVVYVDSDDEECMLLSIQDSYCPIYDSSWNIKFKGKYQTVRKNGAIVVQKKHHLSTSDFVIVFAFSSNQTCSDEKTMKTIRKYSSMRIKNISFFVEELTEDYILPVFGAVGFYLIFYLISPIISITYRRFFYNTSDSENNENNPIAHIDAESVNYETIQDKAERKTLYDDENQDANYNIEVSSSGSGDRLLDDESVSDSQRPRNVLCVSDLSKKNSAVLNRKYFLYLWYVIIISVFYSLPVIQLVINYQRTVEVTGNQDICFYNFRCTRPFSIFIAFNNIMSNIGYVFLGILFTLLTWGRHTRYNECKLRLNRKGYNLGIPQYYGLFYAMGVSLTMEGIMSACYHICPSHDNFQFDTAYMYILASLCVIKIYQIRHPDINATAHSFYMIMALFILIGVIGVVFDKLIFWVIFSILYLLGLLVLTCEIYYLGKWTIDIKLSIQIYNSFQKDKWLIFIPKYHIRMIVLLIFNVVNISFCLYGAIHEPSNFSSYFLSIFMINLLLYFFIYIILKIVYCEKIYHISIIYVLVAIICWSFSIYCFIKHPTDWEESPALSREQNTKCLLFNFYDIHDIWHFLSSLSMFFSFMALINIDDSLFFTERDKIVVF